MISSNFKFEGGINNPYQLDISKDIGCLYIILHLPFHCALIFYNDLFFFRRTKLFKKKLEKYNNMFRVIH